MTTVRVINFVGFLLMTSSELLGQGGGGLSGTVYFSHLGGTWRMNPDGSNKTALPAGVAGEPSRLLHGGHRWFLQIQEIAGQTYPSQSPWPTRREIFAIRDDGNTTFAVQLTTQGDLETNGNVRWLPGDGQISWIARRWVSATAVEGGVYAASINFDASGNVTGLVAQPTAPAVAMTLVPWTGNTASGYFFQNDLGPDLFEHDWAPTGTQYVYDRFSVPELRVATVGGSDALVHASTWVRTVAWSPDGTKIAFRSQPASSFGGLYTISPSGANLKRIIKDGTSWSVALPRFSPSGANLVYQRFNNLGFPTDYADVYRTTATGNGNTNLTGSVQTASPIAWR